ncbi:flagellar hook-associated protein 2 [Carnobacterium sp. 17-4]|uniref:flagellar filament capping protein FliD n=1 Tax=Carnobacterium sp. (strain 17-4) TaxID=208596 RepID=UPI0002058B17|nr:flagellar filament capping protein FliD [Carnobacterium sp. 17-4]AEB30660.1 flagellar hook-associated protein 2 [Carnobacterium sp. 17-4]
MASSISFLGSYSGIDSATIDSMIQAESGKLVQYTNKQTSITAEKNAWKDINTRLDSLFTKLGALGEAKTFLSKIATSSDATKVAITANTDAAASNYAVEVKQLATSTQATSGVISSADGKTIKDSLGLSGTFTIINQENAGPEVDGKPTTGGFKIEILKEDSLKDIVGKINEVSKESGIQAKIVDNRIVMTDSKMGARTITFDGDLTVEDGSDPVKGSMAKALGFEAGKIYDGGKPAILTVDGIEMTRNTNNITDAIEGLTIDLKGVTEASKPVTIGIKEDTDTTIKAFQSFVDQYNSTLAFIDDQLDVGDPSAEDNKTGALTGDSSLMRLQSSLRSLMTGAVNTGNATYNNLETVGISVDRYGAATLDTEKLKKALADDPTAVKKMLFQTTTTETPGVDENGKPTTITTETEVGIAQKMRALVDTYISEKTGIIATKSETYDKSLEDLSSSITKFNERLVKKRENYVAMFTRLDTAMMEAESQLAYLQSQFSTTK